MTFAIRGAKVPTGKIDPLTATLSMNLVNFDIPVDKMLLKFPLSKMFTLYCLVADSSLEAIFTLGER